MSGSSKVETHGASNEQLNGQTYEAYRNFRDRWASGPQVDGLVEHDLQVALKDKDSLVLSSSLGCDLPVITPLHNNSELNQRYFAEHAATGGQYYFDDVAGVIEASEGNLEQLKRKLKKIAKSGGMVVTDFCESLDGEPLENANTLKMLLDDFGVEYEEVEFTDPRNNSSAAVYHYAGEAIPKGDGKIADTVSGAFSQMMTESPHKYNDKDGIMIVKPDELDDGLFDKIWEMYESQFDTLISENPSLQKQTREDLFSTLHNENMLLSVKYEEGTPVCAAYFVRDLKSIYWIRPEFYESAFPDKDYWFFPGIVSDPNSSGAAHSLGTIRALTEAAYRSGSQPFITFQCTNISNDYIPKIVKRVVGGSGMLELDLKESAVYKYYGYRLKQGAPRSYLRRILDLI